MRDTILPVQTNHVLRLSGTERAVLQDSIRDSVFPYSGIDAEAMSEWLIMPQQTLRLTDSGYVDQLRQTASHKSNEAFYPPLPARTWIEKQYHTVPIIDEWAAHASMRSISFAVLLLVLLLSVFLRFRFWRYYTEYAKLLFHPRSVQRVSEVDGPHIGQFHFFIDFTNIISLTLLFWNAMRLPLVQPLLGLQATTLPLVITFAILLLYYFLRFVILHVSSYLIKQNYAAQLIWQQFFFIHRILWPYYLLIALLSFLNVSVLVDIVLYGGLLLVFAASIYAQVRVLLTFICFHYNLFYYFLYLCVLGIAPWLGLVRWLRLV
jgi:membrane protein